jgi:GT2 family glycosyltransferase
MNQEDWVRPDLLFRFEQTLRLIADPEKTVLFCDENQLTRKNFFIPGSEQCKPKQLHFPYFFESFSENGLLIPKKLWKKIGGLRSDFLGAEFEDLMLRLEMSGAIFQHIPIILYSARANSKRRTKSHSVFLNALTDYSKARRLNWNWFAESHSQDIVALPKVNTKHIVQIIIPFKDQKAITLTCVNQVLKQKEIKFKIIAIDNRSEDKTIAKEIERLGGEVLYVDEPFNYSRLNNRAVKETRIASDCDLVLFLNNDVELEPDALLEMVIFLDVDGFDEVWFPIYHSDTHLVMKLKHKGLLCLYTPYAKGIHHESISCGKIVGDYENSLWFHQLVHKKQNDLGFSTYTR